MSETIYKILIICTLSYMATKKSGHALNLSTYLLLNGNVQLDSHIQVHQLMKDQ